ncbi:MAG: hypothetical protein JSW05_09345 [Candidatus Thorarchaeota archaeon]|nr:MAG: hypothetical protein JSW05_09345 [Candidatus Thorarchaeota archaeon]
MVGSNTSTGITALIDIDFPMVDVLAVTPYVIPLLFIGTAVLLYQRHLPREALRRNLLVAGGLGCLVAACVMTLYAAFGGTPWVPGQDFGSWLAFMGAIQLMTDLLYGSVYVGVIYIILISVIFAVVAAKVISPPDPDFVALRSDLKETQDASKSIKADMQKLEEENKRLQEFLSERESSLTAVQAQLDAIKDETAERERAMVQMQAKLADTVSSPEREEELLMTITHKDQTISDLQSEVAHLKLQVESAAAVPDSDSKYRDYVRRAQTAVEVSDSVISDLAELISQVESSSLDVAAQIALTTLIKSMGRAMGRVSEAAGGAAEPRIELIGAVMMAHEVVDAVKKLTRGT